MSFWIGRAALVQIEDVRNVGLKFLDGFGKPNGMQMRFNEVAVSKIESRRAHNPAYHRLALAEIVLVVWTLCCAVGQTRVLPDRIARAA